MTQVRVACSFFVRVFCQSPRFVSLSWTFPCCSSTNPVSSDTYWAPGCLFSSVRYIQGCFLFFVWRQKSWCGRTSSCCQGHSNRRRPTAFSFIWDCWKVNGWPAGQPCGVSLKWYQWCFCSAGQVFCNFLISLMLSRLVSYLNTPQMFGISTYLTWVSVRW